LDGHDIHIDEIQVECGNERVICRDRVILEGFQLAFKDSRREFAYVNGYACRVTIRFSERDSCRLDGFLDAHRLYLCTGFFKTREEGEPTHSIEWPTVSSPNVERFVQFLLSPDTSKTPTTLLID